MKIKSILEKFKKGLFNLNWTCNVCDKENFNGQAFCEDCKENLPYLRKGNYCNNCGRKTVVQCLACDSCKDFNKSIKNIKSVFNYCEPISTLIQKFKYEGSLYLGEVFAKELSLIYFTEFLNVDGIVYIPMTKSRLKERGYNQSYILAKELSKIIGVEVIDCIVKTEDTTRQALLNRIERLKNLKGTFKVLKRKVKNKNLLIIDDVMTTGATLEVIASELKKKEAKNVYAFTVASVSKVKEDKT